ncbi:GerAB/ArcD/ProY family transporter [Bacillus pinisoli]|uniref:GerAB/ArcD/ProY family transporter n=1 Tax=Bacillus pinisoli TaxID=2901866 RepID=UPI001FF528E2|nr:GerAB/ArcD/ProY family transporter [Bacillus pinisoli]
MERIPNQYLISPFLVFYLIHSMQVGVGLLGFQRVVAKSAENDAWIGVLIGGIAVHLLIWMMYKILEKSNGDITDVHNSILGKWVGRALSTVLMIYFILLAITVLRTYIEIVQVWVFPGFSVKLFAAVFLLLVFYIINGGFRTVTGIAVLGVILPLYLILTFIFPLKYAFFENLLPIMDHSILEILQSTKGLTLTILGFEALLVYYPFIKDPKKSIKWAQFGALFTIALYLLVLIISLAYFSIEQLERTIWASLTILKIGQLPFVERIEYVGIASWILVILPNICISIWAASRIAKKVFKIRQRILLIVILGITYASTILFSSREQINLLNEYTAQIGFYVIYLYIPLMFFISYLYYRKKENLS